MTPKKTKPNEQLSLWSASDSSPTEEETLATEKTKLVELPSSNPSLPKKETKLPTEKSASNKSELKEIEKRLLSSLGDLSEKSVLLKKRTPAKMTPTTWDTTQKEALTLSDSIEEKDTNIDSFDNMNPQEKIYSVRELFQEVNPLLKTSFGMVSVRGEVSNFKQAASGHLYFSLKDVKSTLNVAFLRFKFSPKQYIPSDGVEVICRGELNIYEERGSFQMAVHSLEPVGMGHLAIEFEKLKGKLQAEGYFDASQKQEIPPFPRKIGLVTSAISAALQDMLNVFQRRAPKISLVLLGVQVQGMGAAQQIAQAIQYFNTRTDIDLLIVARGGGSIEDLWAFNEEIVVKAVFESNIPIVSGVGHETDTTLIDLAADKRAITPSAAAEEATKTTEEDMESHFRYYAERYHKWMSHALKKRELAFLQMTQKMISPEKRLALSEQKLQNTLHSLETQIQRKLQKKKDLLSQKKQVLLSLNPSLAILTLEKRNSKRMQELHFFFHSLFQSKQNAFLNLIPKLDALSPLRVLERGYSLTYNMQQKIVIRAEQLQPGDDIQVLFSEGKILAEVKKIEK